MILDFLSSIHWTLSITIVALLCALFTVFSILLVRKRVNLGHLKSHHDITCAIFSNLGALYAVLLGFTIINAQERFDKIQEAAQVEAARLDELYRGAEFFSEVDKKNIRNAIKDYVQSIVNTEWNQGEAHKETTKRLRDLWQCYYNAEIATPKETIWYTESVGQLNELVALRFARLAGNQQFLRSEMWTVLLLGGCALVVFLCFFGPDKPGTHLLMASILSISIALSLFLIYSLDSVFTGSVSIKPEALGKVLQMIEQEFQSF